MIFQGSRGGKAASSSVKRTGPLPTRGWGRKRCVRNCSWGAMGDREPRRPPPRPGWGGRRAWGSQGAPARAAGGCPGRRLGRKARRGGRLLPTRDEGLEAEGGLARSKRAFMVVDPAAGSSALHVAYTRGL